jgi:hypothetical protein
MVSSTGPSVSDRIVVFAGQPETLQRPELILMFGGLLQFI